MLVVLGTSHCARMRSVPTAKGLWSQVKQMKQRKELQDVFHLRDFKPGQLEAMLPVLHGQDTFVRMATGGGKSLCMFLVPVACSGTSMGIIISPLNALMDEQV